MLQQDTAPSATQQTAEAVFVAETYMSAKREQQRLCCVANFIAPLTATKRIFGMYELGISHTSLQQMQHKQYTVSVDCTLASFLGLPKPVGHALKNYQAGSPQAGATILRSNIR